MQVDVLRGMLMSYLVGHSSDGESDATGPEVCLGPTGIAYVTMCPPPSVCLFELQGKTVFRKSTLNSMTERLKLLKDKLISGPEHYKKQPGWRPRRGLRDLRRDADSKTRIRMNSELVISDVQVPARIAVVAPRCQPLKSRKTRNC